VAQIRKRKIPIISYVALYAVAIVAIFSMQGCVKRVVAIDTSPQGADVIVLGENKGVTPCAFEFKNYGTYQIRLVKEGYEELISNESIRPPLYQLFPLDLIFELLVPKDLEDSHTFVYQLTPKVKIDED